MDPEPSHPRPFSRGGLLRAGLRAGLLGAGLALLCLAEGGPLLAWNALVFVFAAVLPVTYFEFKALERPLLARRVCASSLLAFFVAFFALTGSLLQAIYLTQRWSTNASGLQALQVGVSGLSKADPLFEVALPIAFLTVVVVSGLLWRLLTKWDQDAHQEGDSPELMRGLLMSLTTLGGIGVGLLLAAAALDLILAAGLTLFAVGGVFGGLCLAAYYVFVDRIAEVVEAS